MLEPKNQMLGTMVPPLCNFNLLIIMECRTSVMSDSQITHTGIDEYNPHSIQKQNDKNYIWKTCIWLDDCFTNNVLKLFRLMINIDVVELSKL